MRKRIKKHFGHKLFNYQNFDYKDKSLDVGTEFNSIIRRKPSKHTIIFIIEALRCAVTLEPKENIGILYDRESRNDDVMIQGLAGRATGYDVPKHIVVYTDVESVNRYIEMWKSKFKHCEEFRYAGSTSRNPIKSLAHPRTFTNAPTSNDSPEIRVKKNPDKRYEVFNTREKAICYAKRNLGVSTKSSWGKNVSKDKPVIKSPADGGNPTLEDVINRFQCLGPSHPQRLVYLRTGEWCIYWDPKRLKR